MSTRPAHYSARYHVVGVLPEGPIWEATRVVSTAEYEAVHGPRSGNPELYDDLAVFFAEGGREAYVTRATDTSPAGIRDALAAAGNPARGGALAAPGLPAGQIGATLLDHAAVHQQIALLAGARDTTAEELSDEAFPLRTADTGDHALVLWPWVITRDGQAVPPTGYAAAARARAHLTGGYWTHPAGPRSTANTLRRLRFPNTRARNEELSDLLISPIVTTRDGVQIHGWWSLSPDAGNFPHTGVRDLLNNIAADLATGYDALTARSWGSIDRMIGEITGHTRSVLTTLAKKGAVVPRYDEQGWPVDPGYTIEVTVPEPQPEDRNSILVAVSVRPHRAVTLVGVRLFRVDLLTPFPTPETP